MLLACAPPERAPFSPFIHTCVPRSYEVTARIAHFKTFPQAAVKPTASPSTIWARRNAARCAHRVATSPSCNQVAHMVARKCTSRECPAPRPHTPLRTPYAGACGGPPCPAPVAPALRTYPFFAPTVPRHRHPSQPPLAPPAALLPPVACTGVDPKDTRVTRLLAKADSPAHGEPAAKQMRMSDWGDGGGVPTGGARTTISAPCVAPTSNPWAAVVAAANGKPSTLPLPPANSLADRIARSRAAAAGVVVPRAPEPSRRPPSSNGSCNSSSSGGFWCTGAPAVASERRFERVCRPSVMESPTAASASSAEAAPTPALLLDVHTPTSHPSPRVYRTTEWTDSPFFPSADSAAAAAAVAPGSEAAQAHLRSEVAACLPKACAPSSLRDDSAREGGEKALGALCEVMGEAGEGCCTAAAASAADTTATRGNLVLACAQAAASTPAPLMDLMLPFSPGRSVRASLDGGVQMRQESLLPSGATGPRHVQRQIVFGPGPCGSSPQQEVEEPAPSPEPSQPQQQQPQMQQQRQRQQQQNRGFAGGSDSGFSAGGAGAGSGADWRRTQAVLLSSLVKTWYSSSVGPAWLRGMRPY